MDELYVSQEFCREGKQLVTDIRDAEAILNCIGILICPELHSIGTTAIDKLIQSEDLLHTWHKNVTLWPSFFSGIEFISNRKTPSHRDGRAAASTYDFLVSAGRHTEARLDLPDIDTQLSYDPGTVVAICGRVLRHRVEEWKGERLCVAHFIRDAVHNRLGLPRADWVKNGPYLAMMDKAFLARQHWVVD